MRNAFYSILWAAGLLVASGSTELAEVNAGAGQVAPCI
jgi:hypothetical protein